MHFIQKTKVKFIIITLILLCGFSINSFSQTYLGPILGVKHGDLQAEASLDFFDLRAAPSVGLLIKKETKHRLYFTAAISVEKTGWIETFDGNGNVEEIYLKGNAIALSLGLGYYLINSNKFKLGIASGIKGGTVTDSTFDYFPKLPDSFLFGPSITFSTIETSLDFCYNLSDQIAINLSPNYSFVFQKKANDFIWRNPGIQASLLFKLSHPRTRGSSEKT